MVKIVSRDELIMAAGKWFLEYTIIPTDRRDSCAEERLELNAKGPSEAIDLAMKKIRKIIRGPDKIENQRIVFEVSLATAY